VRIPDGRERRDVRPGEAQVAIERTECRQAAIRVVRQADGIVNFARLVRATGSTGTRDVGSRPASADTGWSVVTRKLLLERVTPTSRTECRSQP
jgi:hypothetical protein